MVVNDRLNLRHESILRFNSLHIKISLQVNINLLLFWSHLFAFFDLRAFFLKFSLLGFVKVNEFQLCVLYLSVTSVEVQHFLADEAGVEVWAEEIGITRCNTLHIDKVPSLVSSLDAFDLRTPCNLHFVPLSINNLLNLDVQFLAHFSYHSVRFRGGFDGTCLLNDTVLSQRKEITVVQDAWNDGLSDDAVTTIVDKGCGKLMESFDF